MKRLTGKLLIPLASILAALLLNALIIALAGRDPLMIFQKMLRATLASPYGTGQVLFKTTTLVLTALAVVLPFRARLFNIGAEGQLLMGAFAAAMAGTLLPAATPGPAALTICIAAAVGAGAGWALLAGLLKIRFGVNEVIATIMLNFIAQGLTGYLLTRHFALPSTVHTAPIVEGARIARFSELLGWFPGSPANLSLLLAVGAAVASWYLLFRTRSGYELRAAGMEPDAAAYAGIDAARKGLLAMALGGAAAGLGAANLVLGYKYFYEAGMSAGVGFTGIAAALLGGAHPLWAMLAAAFFGLLDYGGLTVNAWVPKDLFMIMQAITILLVISFTALQKRG